MVLRLKASANLAPLLVNVVLLHREPLPHCAGIGLHSPVQNTARH